MLTLFLSRSVSTKGSIQKKLASSGEHIFEVVDTTKLKVILISSEASRFFNHELYQTPEFRMKLLSSVEDVSVGVNINLLPVEILLSKRLVRSFSEM